MIHRGFLKNIGWAILAGALAVFLYSMLGMIQNASFSAGPNYPHELAVRWHYQWLTAQGISLFIALCAAVFLWIKRKRPSKERKGGRLLF